MTIAQIIAARDRGLLIRESDALRGLSMPSTPKSKAWLRSRIAPEIARLRKLTYLYRLGDIDMLKRELDQPES